MVASFTLEGGSIDLSAFLEVASKGIVATELLGSRCGKQPHRRLLTLVFALPGAYVLAHATSSGDADSSMAAVTVPFVLPTVVVGAAYLALLRS